MFEVICVFLLREFVSNKLINKLIHIPLFVFTPTCSSSAHFGTRTCLLICLCARIMKDNKWQVIKHLKDHKQTNNQIYYNSVKYMFHSVARNMWQAQSNLKAGQVLPSGPSLGRPGGEPAGRTRAEQTHTAAGVGRVNTKPPLEKHGFKCKNDEEVFYEVIVLFCFCSSCRCLSWMNTNIN